MNVILNVVKNLSESVGVLLLCYPVDASLSLSMTKHSEEMLRFRSAMTYSVNEIATSLKALAMTEYGINLAMTMLWNMTHLKYIIPLMQQTLTKVSTSIRVHYFGGNIILSLRYSFSSKDFYSCCYE